ncbi:hypothetical protein [Microbacterium gorillae]|uniref:hypothetical protein n=1 Tax=Microbacterium gorillae TaxID=1231063 RepID=UPI00058B762A|nr:hypothetical protein [Microbacterium gorillae]
MSDRARGMAALVLVGAVILLAACFGGRPDGGATGTPGPDPASTVPSGDNGDLTDPVGARDALVDDACAADEGGVWSGTGTIRNTGEGAVTYLVRFSVVDVTTHAVLGSGDQELTVEAGASAPVAVPAFYTQDGDAELSCHARVVSGTAG